MHQLPKRCLVVLPGMPAGRNVAVCVRGESGVRLTRLDFGADVAATPVVRELNRALGIGAAQERQMLIGCLLGWEVPRAGRAPRRDGTRLLH